LAQFDNSCAEEVVVFLKPGAVHDFRSEVSSVALATLALRSVAHLIGDDYPIGLTELCHEFFETGIIIGCERLTDGLRL
jgi:hypothetical protein